MLHEILTITGIVILGKAFRCMQVKCFRKIGAILYLAAFGCMMYFITDSWIIALLSIIACFFLPWLELIFRVRKVRFPIDNQLQQSRPSCNKSFPEVQGIMKQLEESDYEHISDTGWKWDKATQYFSLYHHSEDKHTAAVCQCAQSCVTFCYITVTSTTKDGKIYRTTNYPFSPTLKAHPKMINNHVSCEGMNSLEFMLYAHNSYLFEKGLNTDTLIQPDPERAESQLENEIKEQINYNLENGLIQMVDGKEFRYSFKGLVFLWKQVLKDLIRLC